MNNPSKTNDLSLFLSSLPDDIKRVVPLTAFRAKEVGSGFLRVDKSERHNTDFMPCYWFYKPISQMYKTFENE